MKQLTKEIQAQFDKMCQTGKLFKSSVTGQQVWEMYLNSFNDDPKFRDPESSIHNCNYCKNFIRRYGNIVTIIDGEIVSIFTNLNALNFSDEYLPSMENCDKLVRESKIVNVFFENAKELLKMNPKSYNRSNQNYKLGIEKNHKRYTREEAEKFGVVKPNEIRTFDHFNLNISEKFVDKSNDSVEAIQAKYRTKMEVFMRLIEDVSLDALLLTKDLFAQGSFLNGDTYLPQIDAIIPHVKKFFSINSISATDNWFWEITYDMHEAQAKIRNHQIGKTLVDIAEGKDLNIVWKEWNRMEDPTNKHKPKAPISEKMKRDAQKFVEENDYVESFTRRFATIDDIKVSEIKHINTGDGKPKTISLFDNIKTSSKKQKKNQFANVEEVSIDKFMKDVLPSCASIEAYFENRMVGNLVTMTTANCAYKPRPIFKWDNPYSWTFNGNLAGKSQLKDAVKSRGGAVDGVLNIRLAFPETTDDYDLHMEEPSGNRINYRNVRQKQLSSGMLDLDAQGVDGHQPAEKRVENITYSNLASMPVGEYVVRVNDYSGNGFRARFLIEIETPEGMTVLTFDSSKKIGSNVDVAKIALKNGEFTIKPCSEMVLEKSTTISKELWGIETNSFHKVNLMCLSPNHWGENVVGNKHYMFMLENCKSDLPIRSFHNENLISELLQHRKVMEVLGASNMLEPSDKQLAGLGFNATVKDELIVKCSGSFNRMLKIKF